MPTTIFKPMQIGTLTIPKVLNNAFKLGSFGYQKLPLSLQQKIAQPILMELQKAGLNDCDLSFLQGKVVGIEITDIHHNQSFTVQKNNITLVPNDFAKDVIFKGEFNSFLQLITQSCDPDTLFFQRKLSITGNTELGLEVKALFEYLNLERLPLPLRKGIQCLQYMT
jgi:predicted lipid carrier protein YhbT